MLTTVVLLLASVYAGIVLYLATMQRSFIFKPPSPPPPLEALADAGYAPLDHPARGKPLFWYAPPGRDDAHVVVFFHGNATTAVCSIGKTAPLRDAGLGVLLVEYPGFGHAAGSASEAAILAAARDGLDALSSRGIDGSRIVLWGESLGTGVATQVARGAAVAGVVLEAPFTSVADRAQEIYWWTPARWLVRDRFDNLSRIATLGAPLLIAHGDQDRVTPAAHGRRLLAAAAEPKTGFFAPLAGHADLPDHGLTAEILRFVAGLRPRQTP